MYRGETNTIHVTLIHFLYEQIKSNQDMFTAAIPETASFRIGRCGKK